MSLQCCIDVRWLGFVDSGGDERSQEPDKVVRPRIEVRLDILLAEAEVEEVLAQRVAQVRVLRCGDNVGEQPCWSADVASAR